ncbi:MAG: hypothetical protein WCS03_05905 [Bacteroidota bacterium]
MKSILLNPAVFFALLLTTCSVKNEPVRIKFEGAYSEKKWAIKELNPEIPSDWSSSGFLTFEIKSSTTQRFELKLYDSEGIRRLEILPFQAVWIRASIPLIHFQNMNTEGMDQASIWKTPRPGYWIGFTGAVGSISQIDSLGIAMSLPVGSPSLEIRNVRLTMSAEDTIFTSKPLVDEFGQWLADNRQGKAKTAEYLKTAWTEEEKALQYASSAFSKYGGFPSTKAPATGFFRTEKIDGKWWFIDPEGYLFFSNGSNCIESRTDFSRIKGREYLFTELPPAAESASSNHPAERGERFSFYTWNLNRRFGSDWYQKWMELTFLRMDNWGLNTIGNWSDPALGGSHRKAYVATLNGWGIETGTMGMPDVYASGYIATVDSAASRQCAPKKDDPFLLGYFIGNEPPWPGRESDLIDVILNGKETQMKSTLLKYLSAGDTPDRRKAFVYDTYSRFINIVCSAVKKYDPNHLNLGLRFGDTPAKDIITASKKYFDVFSINHYGYEGPVNEIQKIYDLTGLPVIIGEFHFGTPGRGLAPGLAQTINQEERGIAYRYYVENAAAHPAVIGTHWFQWIDQPSTGRFDGENYNIGLVDVTDRPYPEMINAVKETFNRLQDVHSGKEAPVSRQAKRQ